MDSHNVPDEAINQFLTDLQTIKTEQNNIAVQRTDTATPDNLEEFILKNSSEVINSAVSMMRNVETNVQAIQGPEEIAAYSELVNASTNAIETLSKILIQKKKTETMLTVKKMDVENKKELQTNDHQMKFLASREDLLKMMLSTKPEENKEIVVEAEPTSSASFE